MFVIKKYSLPNICSWFVTILLLSSSSLASAILDIEVTQAMDGAMPIAVVPFAFTPTDPLAGLPEVNISEIGRAHV